MFWLSFRLALVCLSQQFSWSMWIDAVTSSIKFKQYTSHTGLKYQHVAMILTSTMVNYLQCGNETSFFGTISVNIHCHFNLEKMLLLYVNIANLIVYLVHLQTDAYDISQTNLQLFAPIPAWALPCSRWGADSMSQIPSCIRHT